MKPHPPLCRSPVVGLKGEWWEFGKRGRLRWSEDGSKKPKERTVYRVDGGGPPVEFGVFANNMVNLRRGIVERVLGLSDGRTITLPPPSSQVAWQDRWLKQFADTLCHAVGRRQPSTYAQFLKLYEGDRRARVYGEAVESLRCKPVQPWDAICATFLKCEKHNLSKKPDAAGRVIQPRTPRYNAAVGRFLKPLEKVICRAIGDIYGGPTIMKGYNAVETAEHMLNMWRSFDTPVAVMLDAKRFDQHVSTWALQYEHAIYRAIYPEYPELGKLLEMQLHNVGIARVPEGKVKYEVEGCRMSGDMNTSLGNCVLMCAMVWALGKKLGLRIRLANNGDDCCIVCDKTDVKRLVSAIPGHFLPLGFQMEVEPVVEVFEEIDFCQTHPVYACGRWIMCRDPRVALAKDVHTVLPLEQRGAFGAYCKAIGDCGLSLCSGMPVMQEFYLSLLRHGSSVGSRHQTATETGFARLASGLTPKVGEVDTAARVSFWRAFGILPMAQAQAEAHYGGVQYSGEVCRREVRTPDFSFSVGQL